MMIQDGYLKSLEIIGYEIALLVENNNICYYSCEISDDISEVCINAEAASSELVYEGDLGNCPLHIGVNTFSVRVFQKGSIQKEYKISVVVKKSVSDVGLSVVEVNNEPAEPVIKDGEISYYYYLLPYTEGQMQIEAYPSAPNATVEGDIGIQEVVEGINGFVIIVKSRDGKNRKSHRLLVECRPDSEQEEPEAPIEILSGQEWVPKPAVISVPEVPEPPVESKPVNLRIVTMLGVTRKSNLSEEELYSAIASGEMTEDYFKNKLTDDTMIVSVPLVPSFSHEIKRYQSFVGHEVSALFIMASPEQKDYEITGNVGYVPLVTGENQLSIAVKGAAGYEEYEFFVERQEVMNLQEIYELEQKITDVLAQEQVEYEISEPPVEQEEPEPLVISEEKPEKEKTAKKRAKREKKKTRPDKKKRKLNSFGTKFKVYSGRMRKGETVDKRAVRTTKLLHKLIGTTLFMASVSYLLYTYLLEPNQVIYKNRQEEQLEIANKRRTVEDHLKNRENMLDAITLSEEEILSFRERYPDVPSQEEILLYLNELNSEIMFEYYIITVGMEEPVYSGEITSAVADKNIGGMLPDMATVTPPGVQTASNADSVPEDGGGSNLRHSFKRNTVYISIRGKYDDLLQVYEEISNSSRVIIGDNVQLVRQREAGAEGETWDLSMDMIYYHYTGMQEKK